MLVCAKDWVVQTSCGYAVPMVSSTLDPTRIEEGPRAYLEDRKTLGHWAGQRIEKGEMQEYRQKMNSRSLDGCSGLKVARRQRGEYMLAEGCFIWLRRVLRQREPLLMGAVLGMLVMVGLRVLIEALQVRVPGALRLLT